MKAMAFIVVLAWCSGCTLTRYAAPPPTTQAVVFDPWVARGADQWRSECIRSLGIDPVIVAGHGASYDGSWYVVDNAGHALRLRDVLLTLRKAYPDRYLMVLTCNTGPYALDIPGVIYARRLVYVIPTRSAWWPQPKRWAAGGIEEFWVNPMVPQ